MYVLSGGRYIGRHTNGAGTDTPTFLARPDQVLVHSVDSVDDQLPKLHCHSGEVMLLYRAAARELSLLRHVLEAFYCILSLHLGTFLHATRVVVVGLLQPALCASKSHNVARPFTVLFAANLDSASMIRCAYEYLVRTVFG